MHGLKHRTRGKDSVRRESGKGIAEGVTDGWGAAARAPGGMLPTAGVPGRGHRRKTAAEKSRLCSSVTTASSLQRC